MAVLRPFRPEAILGSVWRTGRLMVVDTGWKTLNMGAEIVATVTEQAFGRLRCPPVRLGLPDRPPPATRALAADYYPTALTVFDKAAAMVDAPPHRVAAARAALAAAQEDIPVDVPVADMRSPF